MPLSSMTGFGVDRGEVEGLSWAWELKSVNGKALDLRLRLPTGFETLEPTLKIRLSQHCKRGNVQANLSVTSSAEAGSVVINEAVLAQYAAAAERLRKQYGGGALEVGQLLGLRGVIEQSQAQSPVGDLAEKHGAVLLASFETAAAALDQSRRKEGEQLRLVLAQQLDRIEELTIAARDCPARSIESVKERLSELVAKLLESSSKLDPDRLHQEAVIIATRADIQEEIDRLFAHVKSARSLIAQAEPSGRKLDFLAQEFNREANTLCSKAQDIRLTGIGLDLKTTIDQMREQVQNIE